MTFLRKRHPPLAYRWSMIFFENQYPLFGIMLYARRQAVGHDRPAQGATLMKFTVSAACVVLLLGAGAAAQTLDELRKDGNGGSTDNVLTYGMGYHQHRYSPLKQINKQTV